MNPQDPREQTVSGGLPRRLDGWWTIGTLNNISADTDHRWSVEPAALADVRMTHASLDAIRSAFRACQIPIDCATRYPGIFWLGFTLARTLLAHSSLGTVKLRSV